MDGHLQTVKTVLVTTGLATVKVQFRWVIRIELETVICHGIPRTRRPVVAKRNWSVGVVSGCFIVSRLIKKSFSKKCKRLVIFELSILWLRTINNSWLCWGIQYRQRFVLLVRKYYFVMTKELTKIIMMGYQFYGITKYLIYNAFILNKVRIRII